MESKIISYSIICNVLITDDNGNAITMIETKPVSVFKGQFNVENFNRVVEGFAIQSYREFGLKGNQ